MRKETRQSIVVQSQSAVRTGKLTQIKGDTQDTVRHCPCCNQIIEPKVVEYLPRPGTYKQYRCKHCSAWLTIDLQSRIKLIALGSLGLFATASVTGLLLVAMKVPLQKHEGLIILPFVLVFGISCQYALARYMKKIAKWVAVDD